jgi:transposase
MPKPCSGDLRHRVVAAELDGGQSRDAVARRFPVTLFSGSGVA